MMNRKITRLRTFLLLGILASSSSCCKMYSSYFDCPPGTGIPCTSVTDIEGMIIETNTGPDVLTKGAKRPWKQLVPCIPPGSTRRIWVADTDTDCGCHIEGHYLYKLPEDQ